MKIEKESHYVYRLTHKHNGEYYYGVRSCNGDPSDDPYMGSSTRMKEEYKHRKKEFRKDVVSVQPTRSLAFVVEGFLVNEWQLSQDKCLNAKLGGVMQHGKCSKDRQQAGIAKALANGVKFGAKSKLSEEQVNQMVLDRQEGMLISECAVKYNISHDSVYRLIREYNNK
jgi:hypothetical protein